MGRNDGYEAYVAAVCDYIRGLIRSEGAVVLAFAAALSSLRR